jgi:phosphatidylglycerophosphate synthase
VEPGSIPSIAELRAIAQPAAVLERRSAEHWTGHLYMRRISIYGTRLALQLGWSADFVTGLMILAGLAAVVTVSIPGLWTAVAGVVLIQLYLGLDCVDGEVARARDTTGARGVYLDRLGHYLVEAGLLIGLGLRAADGALEPVVIGLLAAIGVMLEKIETDLVAVARLAHGLGPADEAASEIKQAGLAKGRRLARWFPVHLATHAAEASLLILAAAIVDQVRADFLASRALLVALAAITAAMVILHLVSILNSRRLDAT